MAKKKTGRPYSGPGDDSLPDNVQALPDHAREIWVAAFNGAWDSWDADKTDLKQEAYAFAVAWAAVKKLYKQKDGEWVKRSVIVQAQGHISKVWRSADGRHRWQATVCDDGVDEYATRMTIEFQDDVGERAIESPPWLGIAHYEGFSQVGDTDRLYRDGRYLKAEGVFLTDSDDELTAALAAAAFESAEHEAEMLPAHRAIAVSQAFYPEEYVIEDCGVVAYTKARMDHIALTTRAANSRADFGVEEDEMSKRATKTRRELRRQDAAAIVGEDLAQTLFDREGERGERRAGEQDGLVYRAADDGSTVEVSPDGGATWEEVDTGGPRAMVPTHRPELIELDPAWDAKVARQRILTWADQGGEAANARLGFAIFDEAEPDDGTRMALPHHNVVDGKLVTHRTGVIVAGALSMGSGGGIVGLDEGDSQHAQRHLGPHYAQMDRTPPWQRDASQLRHWAEAMEEMEALAERNLIGADDVDRARAYFRHQLDEEIITLPTLADARAMFAGEVSLGGALLRATGQESFTDAVGLIISDRLALMIAPGAPRPPEGHRTLQPDADYRAELADRYGAEPDDSVIETLNEHALTQLAYEAAYTFVDIMVANVTAEEEITLQERLGNVQRALNEFGEIMKGILSQSVQPRSRGKAAQQTTPGVKPAGNEPAGGSAGGPEQEAVLTGLDRIRGLVEGEERDPTAMQAAIDDLIGGLERVVDVPQPDLGDALMPILERLTAIEEQIRASRAPAGGDPPGNDPPGEDPPAPRGAPPRRKAFAPSLEVERQAQVQRARRPGPKGATPREFTEGAHRRRVWDPHV